MGRVFGGSLRIGDVKMPDKVVTKVFCPLCEQLNVCHREFKKTDYGDGDQAVVKEVTFVTCGFWSVAAGRCAVGLLVDGLKALSDKADRVANAAEAIYAVMDQEDDPDD